MESKRELSAPCGLDCFNCEVYEKNVTPAVQRAFSEKTGLSPETFSCRGCRAQKGVRLMFTSCDTYECSVKKGVEFCHQCGEFPCEMLQPASEGADRYPHNMKVYNLCRMKAVGVEKWANEEASEIRKRYFKGRFVVGRGPVLDE